MRRDTSPLVGVLEADEAVEGGRDEGRQGGRGTAKGSVAGGAVETLRNDRGVGRCRPGVPPDALEFSLKASIGEGVRPRVTLLTDGWSGDSAEATRGCDHVPVAIEGGGRNAHEVPSSAHSIAACVADSWPCLGGCVTDVVSWCASAR